MNILQVNILDRGGGAEQVAWSLFNGFRQQGHSSWMAVGVKTSDDPDVFRIENAVRTNPWANAWWRLQKLTHQLQDSSRYGERLRRITGLIAEPMGILETLRGYETSRFPGTYRILELPPARPTLLHLHTLHRGYFDLEALPSLTQQVPTVLTLHDAWLLSGHCMHSFDCERWRTGCGNCPDLTIPPRVLRDATARNWTRKRDIFTHSRLWIAAPSQWLIEKAQASILRTANWRVIPLGVDTQVFTPADQAESRAVLGLPSQAPILLFVANRPHRNPWKDYNLLLELFDRLRATIGEDLRLLIIGGSRHRAEDSSPGITLIPYQADPAQLARYYAAADVFVYPTRVESFGLVLTEAMACGKPVVATRIAAVPEQVVEGETGFLTSPGQAEEMASRILQLLSEDDLRHKMGAQARANVLRRFTLERMVKDYLDWYRQITTENATRNHVQ